MVLLNLFLTPAQLPSQVIPLLLILLWNPYRGQTCHVLGDITSSGSLIFKKSPSVNKRHLNNNVNNDEYWVCDNGR